MISRGVEISIAGGGGEMVRVLSLHQQKNHLAPHLSPLTLCA